MFAGKEYTLSEHPNLYMGNPPLTIGKKYIVKYVDGSCFVIDDDEGNETRIGSCRFDLTTASTRLAVARELSKC